MQRVLCDCSIRVTVVLRVRQPQLLLHKMRLHAVLTKKGCGRQLVSFLMSKSRVGAYDKRRDGNKQPG